MGKKVKCPDCSRKGWCSNHLIFLKPLKQNLYLRKDEKMRLCPKFNKSINAFEKIMPIFHGDKKFYTPSFILEQEKNFFRENDQRIKSKHQAKIAQKISQTQTILVAKHGRRKNYCAVCKDSYEDYLKHIQAQKHHESIQKNKYNKYIEQLTAFFKANSQGKPQILIADETADITDIKKRIQGQ